MSQLTGVIFCTIIFLLQGAWEEFPLHKEHWKSQADESYITYHAAQFFLPTTEKAAKNMITKTRLEIQYYSRPRLPCLHWENRITDGGIRWAGGDLRKSPSTLLLKAAQLWGQTGPFRAWASWVLKTPKVGDGRVYQGNTCAAFVSSSYSVQSFLFYLFFLHSSLVMPFL